MTYSRRSSAGGVDAPRRRRESVLEFKETRRFEKEAGKYLTDDELAEIEADLIANPQQGKPIGDLVKVRFGYRGKGKRGGLRVIHLRVIADVIILGSVYPKSVQEDLPQIEYQAVRREVHEVAEEMGLVRRE